MMALNDRAGSRLVVEEFDAGTHEIGIGMNVRFQVRRFISSLERLATSARPSLECDPNACSNASFVTGRLCRKW